MSARRPVRAFVIGVDFGRRRYPSPPKKKPDTVPPDWLKRQRIPRPKPDLPQPIRDLLDRLKRDREHRLTYRLPLAASFGYSVA
jgi:hypothetical protein